MTIKIIIMLIMMAHYDHEDVDHEDHEYDDQLNKLCWTDNDHDGIHRLNLTLH